MTAPSARKDRPGDGRDTRFKGGNPGRPRGTRDRRAVLGQSAARALEAQAWDVVERLLTSTSWRARHEASKTILSYSLGLPRATLELSGGFSDLSKELALALQEARARRAALDAAMPATSIVDAARVIPEAPGVEAPVLVPDVVKPGTERAS